MQDLAGWIGRAREVADEMTAPAARRLCAMLDRDPPDLSAGAEVPAHWLAILFDDAQRQSLLGADGHPAKGEFLPPVDLPRRMLAGRRITYAGALRIGDALRRRSEITAITPKEGRSGRLCFVTVRHSITGPQGLVAVEEQDIAYREAATGESAPKPAPAPLPEPAWRESLTPDTVLLFRYSALTFNGHRIHYDVDYARTEESYPGLVVNGGLSTMMLLDAALRHAPGAHLRSADIRTLRPLICGRALALAGTAPDAQGQRLLWVEDETGAMALRIQARID
jgi:3-methylfumaryl-CoA hydratase